ncbi:hypothetical protein BaRGS_00022231 [Batillaria attramentaria]|uniref:Uncharacterized protein n=1 Tax=Batillaria attramentaria TaxID=370345 RepID=A0ABD0KHS9_9CAEN
MPVEGFPPAVEALLETNTLTSYKIDGRGEDTVVVLRLTGGQPSDTVVTYRRKPLSQVLRDQQRAQCRNKDVARKASESVSSPGHLFMSTPRSKLQTKTDLEMKSPQHTSNILSDAAVQDARETCEFVYTDSPPPSTGEVLQYVKKCGDDSDEVLQYVKKCGDDSDEVLQYVKKCGYDSDEVLQYAKKCGYDSDEVLLYVKKCGYDSGEVLQYVKKCGYDSDEVLLYVKKCGYDSDQVLQYVGELTDKALQHCLKDGRRNSAFRKVVVDDRQQCERLMCESDDIVLVYNCVSDNAYWL